MSDNTYIALTIGPIYKTLNNTRATRELWGASYLFSYMTENIIRYLKEKGIKEMEFVMPYAQKIPKEKLHFGAGIFPDRIIFKKSKFGNRQTMKDAVEATLTKVSKIVKGTLREKGLISENTDIEGYIKSYFQTYIIEMEIPEGKNAILELSPYLDTIELQSQIIQTEAEITRPIKEDKKKTKKDKIERRSFLEMYFEHINGSYLALKVFNDNPENRGSFKHIEGFPSIADIATSPIYKQIPFKIKEESDDAEFYEQLKGKADIKPLLNHYHRYICIVHADGDSIGQAISAIEDGNFLPFSEKLYNFGFSAARLINDYGGKPVYIGGDDLLFFAPVKSGNETIFTLLNAITEVFDNLDFKIAKGVKKPTLSFGVSVSYYKFPMFEALEMSRNLLFDTAKHFKSKEGNEKNAIAFRFLKHSGQYWETTLQKETLLYTQFIELLGNIGISDAALNSLTYKLNETKSILHEVWIRDGEKKTNDEAESNQNPFAHFFDNYFNEEIHQGDSKNYIDIVARLLCLCYQEQGFTKKELESKRLEMAQKNLSEAEIAEQIKKIKEKPINTLYSLLRTLNFLSPKTNKTDEQ